MPEQPRVVPGFLAAAPLPTSSGPDRVAHVTSGAVELRAWGLCPPPVPGEVALLSRVGRDTDGSVDRDRVARTIRSDPAALGRMLPPFAAVLLEGGQLVAVADSMGFQHLFHSVDNTRTTPLVSSSSVVAGRAIGAGLDEVGVGVQSLLGWQLGQRTLQSGVRKLEPGAVACLDETGVHLRSAYVARRDPITLADAVREAATLLRTSLGALLDDEPAAVLQLTGGMDSRLLLSAIPEGRRRGLRAMTLEVPGTGDVAIASAIAQRYGIRHDVRGLSDLDGIDPEQAWLLCRANSVNLDAMADPVALGAQRVAERSFDQGVRISGLGGEIARGFYYTGKVRERSYRRIDAERLASWRMFANEAVEPGLLDPEFASWARTEANDQVYDALLAGGEEWFRATDDLYVRHRMQRWAGATDTAVSAQRIVVNPMLDPGFLELAARLAPEDKAASRFLGALQMELDPELGRMPLEGRPSPSVYADPPWWQPAQDTMALARRVRRKASQRMRRGNRPPAGGALMADKVVDHWRARPELLDDVALLPFVRDEWLAAALSGDLRPRPSSVAFITNLVVATGSPER